MAFLAYFSIVLEVTNALAHISDDSPELQDQTDTKRDHLELAKGLKISF